MTQSIPNTLLLGDIAAAEFEPVIAWLKERDAGGALQRGKDPADVRELLKGGDWFPDLVIVLQSWPDQFSAADVHALLELFPLARIACCFGPWCDSDGRSRPVWPPAFRVPAAAAITRLEHELNVLAGSAVPLPWTASRTEIFEFDFGEDQPETAGPRKLSVISPDRSWREMMQRSATGEEHARDQNGASAVCSSTSHDADDEPPERVLFDADPWNEERAEALAAIRAAVPASKIVALVGFPRVDLQSELHRAGADEVHFKLTSS